jgi:hypothetical protein
VDARRTHGSCRSHPHRPMSRPMLPGTARRSAIRRRRVDASLPDEGGCNAKRTCRADLELPCRSDTHAARANKPANRCRYSDQRKDSTRHRQLTSARRDQSMQHDRLASARTTTLLKCKTARAEGRLADTSDGRRPETYPACRRIRGSRRSNAGTSAAGTGREK